MKNKNRKISTIVGIAAYNAEKNIINLITSILNQKQDSFILEKIVIHSDNSSDQTDLLVKTLKSDKVLLLETKKRSGFAGAIQKLFKFQNCNLLMVLNDDIIIKDNLFIEKTIAPFLQFEKIGMVCSNPQPYQSKNFIEKSVISGINAYNKMRSKVNSGNTVLTCDGKTMTFSQDFLKVFKFPSNHKQMGNIDGYLYFSCITKGYLYRFAEKAVVYFKAPSTISDLVKWTVRNNISKGIFKEKFGDALLSEYNAPFILFNYYRLIEFLKNPIGSFFIFLVNTYCLIASKISNQEFTHTWDLISTTKDLTYPI